MMLGTNDRRTINDFAILPISVEHHGMDKVTYSLCQYVSRSRLWPPDTSSEGPLELDPSSTTAFSLPAAISSATVVATCTVHPTPSSTSFFATTIDFDFDHDVQRSF